MDILPARPLAAALTLGLHIAVLIALIAEPPPARPLPAAPAMTVVRVLAEAPMKDVAPPAAALPQRAAAAPMPAASAPAHAPLRTAQPRSAPDFESLRGLAFSGLPMRLRLVIDASGRVTDVTMLQSAESPDVEDALRRVFLATGFVPARRGDVDVAATKDIEIAFGSTP